ncbi:MAG: SDR family oxidoreductase [Thioalkalispiraceae bacterium]
MNTRYAVITGATGGLGQAVAQQLAASGWSLVLLSRNAEKLDRVKAPKGTLRIVSDVSKPGGLTEAIEQCRNRTDRFPNAMVNCAGSVMLVPLHRMTNQQYLDTLHANLDTAIYSLKEFVRACVDAKIHGSAILVSSVAAQIGMANHEAIAAAKGAIEGLTRSAAATYASHGIRVNAVAPGLMRTAATEKFFISPSAVRKINAQYPLGRYGKAEDVAQAINWLLSNDSEWVTGQVLSVDGGYSALRPLSRTG